MQQTFHSRQYSIRDFEEWFNRGDLELSPKFQRRNVWDPKARSYLIDTIIVGKPIPKIYMRQQVNPTTRQTTREIVDGQQRIRTVIDFLDDGFPILKVHNEDYGGEFFSSLEEDVKRDILKYEFTVDLLQDIPDSEVFEIFARLNTYAVRLNPQELRHARWFGDFRSCVYGLSQEFMKFWETNRVFTTKNILRMLEAEFVSDLLIAISLGIKAKEKGTLDKFYKDYDDQFPQRKTIEKRFRQVVDDIGGIMVDTLPKSNLKSQRLLYPFFCAVYHLQFGLKDLDVNRNPFEPAAYPKLRNALAKVDEILERVKEEGETGDFSFLTAEQRRFYDAYSEHWVHADKRRTLTKYICRLMLKALKK